MKQKLHKVRKRPYINWYDVLFSFEDLKLSEQFYLFKSKHKKMSDNRIAYYVLKKNYSTTTLNEFRYGVIDYYQFGFKSEPVKLIDLDPDDNAFDFATEE